MYFDVRNHFYFSLDCTTEFSNRGLEMQIFPGSDPILLPLSPTITSTIAEHLRLMSERIYLHLSHNCDNLAPELPTDGSWFWLCQQSIKSVPTSQYQYVSAIAHQLAAKFSLTPLEICQIWQLPVWPQAVDLAASLEFRSWYNDAGYLYWQLSPAAVDRWLDYLDRLPSLDLAAVPSNWHTTGTSGSALAIYAHARCCSVLKLAQREKSIAISTDWRIDPADWLHRCRKNPQLDGSIGIFDSLVERRLIQTLMAVVDAIYANYRYPISSLRSIESGDRRYSRPDPNWSRLTIDLAQSWLDFYGDCRMFGEIKRQNPHLAIARCGLTAIVRRYLQILLGTSAVVEL